MVLGVEEIEEGGTRTSLAWEAGAVVGLESPFTEEFANIHGYAPDLSFDDAVGEAIRLLDGPEDIELLEELEAGNLGAARIGGEIYRRGMELLNLVVPAEYPAGRYPDPHYQRLWLVGVGYSLANPNEDQGVWGQEFFDYPCLAAVKKGSMVVTEAWERARRLLAVAISENERLSGENPSKVQRNERARLAALLRELDDGVHLGTRHYLLTTALWEAGSGREDRAVELAEVGVNLGERPELRPKSGYEEA